MPSPSRTTAAASSTRSPAPDYHMTIRKMISEADQGALYWRNRGTHSGVYRGIPPTGKVIEELAISIYRIHDGRIVEVRGFSDTYDFWHEFALLPDLIAL